MKRNCTIFRETYAPLLCLADHIRKQVFDGLHKGRDPMKKNVFFRALPELPKPPPHDPNSGNLVLFFPDVKIQDLKVTWG